VKLDQKLALGYYQRGNAYFEKRDYDRAFADLNDAVRYNPNYDAAF
jgi:tetratricopeptide (TPR) repeat protein